MSKWFLLKKTFKSKVYLVAGSWGKNMSNILSNEGNFTTSFVQHLSFWTIKISFHVHEMTSNWFSLCTYSFNYAYTWHWSWSQLTLLQFDFKIRTFILSVRLNPNVTNFEQLRTWQVELRTHSNPGSSTKPELRTPPNV